MDFYRAFLDSLPSYGEPVNVRAGQVFRCLAYLRGRLRVGSTPVLAPFALDPRDIAAVNRAASVLARHAGLHRYLFIVVESELDSDVAGNIELTYGGSEVFVNIAREARSFGPSTLALLAHEISHKALLEAGVAPHRTRRAEYEVLTDVAAVYMGFGKLLLNGYHHRGTRQSGSASESFKVSFGYLNIPEVALAHAATIAIRDLSSDDLTAGLSTFAERNLLAIYDNEQAAERLNRAADLMPSSDYI